jgi:tripartite-type tricarboxylate transporter receptor subunit TctC
MAMFARISRRRFLLSSSAVAGAPAVLAQPARWPSKTIRIVVAFPPGGLTTSPVRAPSSASMRWPSLRPTATRCS